MSARARVGTNTLFGRPELLQQPGLSLTLSAAGCGGLRALLQAHAVPHNRPRVQMRMRARVLTHTHTCANNHTHNHTHTHVPLSPRPLPGRSNPKAQRRALTVNSSATDPALNAINEAPAASSGSSDGAAGAGVANGRVGGAESDAARSARSVSRGGGHARLNTEAMLKVGGLVRRL